MKEEKQTKAGSVSGEGVLSARVSPGQGRFVPRPPFKKENG